MGVRRAVVVECDGEDCDARLEKPCDLFESEAEAVEWAERGGWAIIVAIGGACTAYCPECQPPAWSRKP